MDLRDGTFPTSWLPHKHTKPIDESTLDNADCSDLVCPAFLLSLPFSPTPSGNSWTRSPQTMANFGLRRFICSTAFVNVAVSSSQPPSSWSELSMPSCGSASCTKSQGSLPSVWTSLRPVGNRVTSPAAAASSAARRWPGGGTSAVVSSWAVSAAASSCAAMFYVRSQRALCQAQCWVLGGSAARRGVSHPRVVARQLS